jgi:hypothetical protein
VFALAGGAVDHAHEGILDRQNATAALAVELASAFGATTL